MECEHVGVRVHVSVSMWDVRVHVRLVYKW